MERKYKITIPELCQVDWNKMTPEETGRFCSICTKGVVDFTNKNNIEIQEYFIKNQGQKVCGRFRNEQVNKFDIQIPQSVLKQRLPFHKAFLLALFIVMGTTLFSCKNHNDDTLGDVVVVEDTIQANHTTGVILPPKDSIQKENITIGDAKYNPNDSITRNIPPPPRINQIKFTKPKPTICSEVIAEEKVGNIRQTKSNVKQKNIIYEVDRIIIKDSSKTNNKDLPDLMIYETIYENPEYPGGLDSFKQYIMDNYKFSKNTNPINDKIVATFVIERDGCLKIVESTNDYNSKELVSILKTSKKWKPGLQNGKTVRNRYEITLHIKTDSIKKLFAKTKHVSKIESITLKYN